MKKYLLLISSFFFLFLYKGNVSANTINSGSGILMNIDTKQTLVSKNEHKEFLTASIAKILTCIIAVEEKELNSVVEITREDLLMEGSKIYLKENEKIYLKDLLYGLMLRSGNDAANAIAKHVSGTVDNFVKLMNKKSKLLGMKNSHFSNPSGLDEDSENKSTAYDMALLMSYCYSNPLYMEINNTKVHKFKTIDNNFYCFLNKHRLISKQTDFMGGKTGYTKKAGRTLVTVFNKEDVSLVAVTFKGSDDFNEHERLFKFGFNKLSKNLYLKKQMIVHKDDNLETVYLKLEKDIYVDFLSKYKYTDKVIKREGQYYLFVYKNQDNYLKINLKVHDFLEHDNDSLYQYLKHFIDSTFSLIT